MKTSHIVGISLVTLLLAGCGGGSTPQDDSGANAVPDQSQQESQQVMTNQSPAEGWTIHMTAQKLLPGNPDMTVNKYCKTVAGDMNQCQIYVTTDNDARMVGVETMVGSDTYNTFTPDEKKLWISTKDLMQQTMTAMPELDAQQFSDVSASYDNSYSKIYLLWDPGKLDMPMGGPLLNLMSNGTSAGTVTAGQTPSPTTPSTSLTTPASTTTTPAAATPSATTGGFTFGTFDIAKIVANGLDDKKGNFESSVLQRNNVGSLELYKLKNNIASHTYANTSQLIYVISGTGTFTIGNKKQAVSGGMLVIIPNGTSEALQNLGGKDSPLIFVTLKTPFDDTDVKWN